MNNELILFLFFIGIVVVSLEIVRLSITESIRYTRQKRTQSQMRRLLKSVQPPVTVLVYGRNQADETEKTVRSLLKSQYHNFDVVVVSDRSTDSTSKRMAKLISKDAALRLRFLQRRSTAPKNDAFKAAYRKSKKGNIVICLQAGETVDAAFLKRAAALQSAQMKWRVPVKNGPVESSLTGLVEKLRIVFARSETVYLAYTKKHFLTQVDTMSTSTTKSFVTSVAPMILLALLLGIAVLTGNLIVIWYGWILFTLYLLAMVWIQAGRPLAERWALTFSAPSALFLLPAAGIVEHLFKLSARK